MCFCKFNKYGNDKLCHLYSFFFCMKKLYLDYILIFFILIYGVWTHLIVQLLQVDLVKRHSFPVYWNGENRRVLRGHWFAQSGGLDWLPLREDVAEQLEFAYRRQVSANIAF